MTVWAPEILPGCPQSYQKDTLSARISSWGTGKSHRGCQVNGEDEEGLVFLEARNCRTTSGVWAGALENPVARDFFHLSDVCAQCSPSATSKPHSKTCCWQCDQEWGIPCGFEVASCCVRLVVMTQPQETCREGWEGVDTSCHWECCTSHSESPPPRGHDHHYLSNVGILGTSHILKLNYSLICLITINFDITI